MTNKALPGEWQGYAPGATDEQYRAWFHQLHGYEAQQIHRSAAAVLVGPLRVTHCGHPISSIVSSGEGTNWCRECEGNTLPNGRSGIIQKRRE